MKLQKLSVKTSLIIFLIFFRSQCCLAMGNESGHAGDLYADEFIALGQALSSAAVDFEKKCSSCFLKSNGTPFTAYEYKEFVKNNLNLKNVSSAESGEMYLDGKEVDAINFENGQTKINRNRWAGYSTWQRLKLVNHEIFGHLNVERDHFAITDHFLPMIDHALQLFLQKYKSGKFIPSYYIERFYKYLGITEIDSDCTSITEDQMDQIRKVAISRCKSEETPISNGHSCMKIEESKELYVSTSQVGLRYCTFTVYVSALNRR